MLHLDPRYQWIIWPLRCKEKRLWKRLGKYHAEEVIELFGNSTKIIFPKLKLPNPQLASERPIVVIAPGGAKNILADDFLRRWPATSYAEVMRRLAMHPVQLVVTGSASDEWVLEHLQEIPFINLIGKLDLLELIALLKQAKLLITHDSGPMHLGKLVDCPTIALFGPTDPSEKVSPHEKVKVLGVAKAFLADLATMAKLTRHAVTTCAFNKSRPTESS